MTGIELIQEAQNLYQEKGLEFTGDHLRILLAVNQYLEGRGIPVNREMVDFTIDVLRAKALAGISLDSSDEEIEEKKKGMIEWLEALGWRRSWFSRPVSRLIGKVRSPGGPARPAPDEF